MTPERPSPEEIIARQTYDIPRVRVPDPRSLFRTRAARLRALAPGHAIADYLLFVARVADAQQASVDALGAASDSGDQLATPALPGAEVRARNQAHGMPALDVFDVLAAARWKDVVRMLASALMPGSGVTLTAVLQGLAVAPDATLDLQARALLGGGGPDLAPATAPLIGAALQVVFVDLAARLGADGIPPLTELAVCPCCGSRPTASVARIGADEAGFRYLHCALCAVEWHRVRIQCTQCAGGKDIHYQSIDDGRPGSQHAVKAECCDACGSYLKIMYMERDPEVDAVADDLATVSLDLLVDAAGKLRSGVNFMLIPGEAAD